MKDGMWKRLLQSVAVGALFVILALVLSGSTVFSWLLGLMISYLEFRR